MEFKIGSLFDGSGGFPLAASMCGITPTWASEVEPYPITVTRSRLPDMEHLGDISRVNGATVEPTDAITFGSPCQDLSIAGKRSGLKHTDGPTPTVRSRDCKGPGDLVAVHAVRRLTPIECARLQGFPDDWGHLDKKESLSDEEYGLWTAVRNAHAGINGKALKTYTAAQMLAWYNKLHTDSAEYKMWGNGIALPPALYVMQGIKEALEYGAADDWMQ